MEKRKLKIAQIAPLWFPIPPEKYGGTERVVYNLCEELTKLGHKVTLFASGDSKTSAKLISVAKKGLISQNIPWQDWWWNAFNHSFAFSKANEFDIIHCHWTPMGMFFQNFVKTPVLHTFHNLPSRDDHRWEILKNFSSSNVVFISNKEKTNSPVRFNREQTIYNGINISNFKFNKNPKNYFLWVGRICEKKGIKNAVLAAKKAKIKLYIAGQIQPMYKDYFENEIEPLLNEDIHYLGEKNQEELNVLYGNAKGFLYPIEWQEPFGLCMAEAQACGTPVIAFDRGSVREVVNNGKTGFVVPFLDKKGNKNIQGLVEAIKKIDEIKREDCRKWVEDNFTTDVMAKNYEKFYYKLLEK